MEGGRAKQTPGSRAVGASSYVCIPTYGIHFYIYVLLRKPMLTSLQHVCLSDINAFACLTVCMPTSCFMRRCVSRQISNANIPNLKMQTSLMVQQVPIAPCKTEVWERNKWCRSICKLEVLQRAKLMPEATPTTTNHPGDSPLLRQSLCALCLD